MYVWMDGWMDGMDGWMGWMDVCMYIYTLKTVIKLIANR